MNILIKLMSIVSLVLAPTLAQLHAHRQSAGPGKEMKQIEVRYSQGDTGTSTGDPTKIDIEIRNEKGEPQLKEFIELLKKDYLTKASQLEVSWKKNTLTINGEVQAEIGRAHV